MPKMTRPPGDLVEGGDFFRTVERVTLCDQADAGCQLDLLGDGRRSGKGNERVEQPVLSPDRDATVSGVGVARLVLVEEHDVLC